VKRVISALIAGVILGSTGVGVAASQWSHHQFGVWCKSDYSSQGVACVKETGTGYGIGITRNFVMVMNNRGKTVFIKFH
jgi:hypothetical protein